MRILIDEEKGVYNEDGSLNLNPNSLTVVKELYVEPSSCRVRKLTTVSSLYARDSSVWMQRIPTPEQLVFNRIVSLKSSFKLPTA